MIPPGVVERFLLPPFRAALAAAGAPEGASLQFNEPRHAGHGVLATAVALERASHLHHSPFELARRIVDHLDSDDTYIRTVEIAPSGFITIHLTPAAYHLFLTEIEAAGADYGRVPARPESTAIIRSHHVSVETPHDTRTAAVASAIASILERNGIDVEQTNDGRRGAITVLIPGREPEQQHSRRILQPGSVHVGEDTGLLQAIPPDIIRFLYLMMPVAAPVSITPEYAHNTTRTNPYWQVQYALARSAALERHMQRERIAMPPAVPFTPLVTEQDLDLIWRITRFPQSLHRAAHALAPDILCDSLLSLAEALHSLLDIARVIAALPPERDARLRLLSVAGQTLRTGLRLLGIAALDHL